VRWATRTGVHVDRTACAWLIRRFIDPDAEFVFVHDADEVPEDAKPFDMRGIELSHHGGRCTFETLMERYGLTDPPPGGIARIVHEAELEDERFDAPEAPGLDVLLRGLSLVADSDEHMLAITEPLYDGLYANGRRATMLGGEPG
jgi:hypothetical protein